SVTIYDKTAPATFAAGKDWPITTWYFFDEDHNIIGSMSGRDSLTIAQQYEIVNPEGKWEFWFPKVFNDYRGLNDNTIPVFSASKEEKQISDTEELAMKVIDLTNAEREKHGLHPFEVDGELIELAQIRAEDVSTKYSHERPDGTRVSKTHGCGENVGAKKSVEKQVTSWMSSEGHRTNILLERYQSIGVGCYQAENGRTYWVQIFRP
ncbi:MAG: CAP domain-containing protein, partial [Oscillospiraceae bacterium]|nr:CAP domain-containing protein [Oscillospiraceae bacterium]